MKHGSLAFSGTFAICENDVFMGYLKIFQEGTDLITLLATPPFPGHPNEQKQLYQLYKYGKICANALYFDQAL